MVYLSRKRFRVQGSKVQGLRLAIRASAFCGQGSGLTEAQT